MKTARIYLSQLIGLALFAGALCGCKKPEPSLPIAPKNNLSLSLLEKANTRSGIAGDGVEYWVWSIGASSVSIEQIFSLSNVENRLCWLDEKDSRFKESLLYFSGKDELKSLGVAEFAASSKTGYLIAFEEFLKNERGIVFCTAWIYDPVRQRLIYVSAKG